MTKNDALTQEPTGAETSCAKSEETLSLWCNYCKAATEHSWAGFFGAWECLHCYALSFVPDGTG